MCIERVGWVNTVRYAVAGWTGKPIAFKPATFYLEVVSVCFFFCRRIDSFRD